MTNADAAAVTVAGLPFAEIIEYVYENVYKRFKSAKAFSYMTRDELVALLILICESRDRSSTPWRPMAAAPKDGRNILICWVGSLGDRHYSECWWNHEAEAEDKWRTATDGDSFDGTPVAWCEITPPPETST